MTGGLGFGGRSPLITYDEAAFLLGVQRASVKQLVQRGHLHSVPTPEDRRRRKLLRSEVEAYAQSHAGKWGYAARSPAQATPPLASPSTPQGISPQAAQAGMAGALAAGLMITALKAESDTALRLMFIGALAAIALLLILEWRRQGKLDAAQARHLERLAKSAEAKPEAFVAELEQMLELAS